MRVQYPVNRKSFEAEICSFEGGECSNLLIQCVVVDAETSFRM